MELNDFHPHHSLRETQVAASGGGYFDELKHDLPTLATLPSRQQESKHLHVVNHIPFSITHRTSEDEDRDADESRSLSNESFRGEATLRLSTQFIDSRRDENLGGEENPREAYLPDEARDLFPKIRVTQQKENPHKQRTLARQWKVTRSSPSPSPLSPLLPQ
jgi:hypothetical protein